MLLTRTFICPFLFRTQIKDSEVNFISVDARFIQLQDYSLSFSQRMQFLPAVTAIKQQLLPMFTVNVSSQAAFMFGTVLAERTFELRIFSALETKMTS